MYFRSGIINLKKPFIFLVGSSLDVDPVRRDVLITLPCPIYRRSPSPVFPNRRIHGNGSTETPHMVLRMILLVNHMFDLSVWDYF